MSTTSRIRFQSAASLFLFACSLGCSRQQALPPTSTTSGIETNRFAVLESELSPAILVHSQSKYLGVFADNASPFSYMAFSTRTGPRTFRRAQKLKADEMEESWLLLWSQNIPPWVVYLQHKPLALSFDTNGLHFSFANGAGDVALLPLHGSSTNVDTAKWPEFLTREPLLRIRYWASALREFPFECQTSIGASNTVRQRFRFHSIRDDWNTKPLQLAPISPSLARIADEQLKRKLMDLKMSTPFGPYLAFEGVHEWSSSFPSNPNLNPTCPWATLGDCDHPSTNTALIHPIQTSGWPRSPDVGSIKPDRDRAPPHPTQTLINRNSRVISYD
jgi:hypothetical protein